MGGGKGSSDDAGDAAKMQAAISSMLFQESTPLRTNLNARYMNFLNDPENFDVTSSPIWSPARRVLDEQYQNTIDEIMSRQPVGGAMSENLTNAAIAKQDLITNLTSQVLQDEYNKAYGVAYQTPQTSIAGLSGAGSTYAQAAQAEAAQNQGTMGLLGDLGSTAGMLYGLSKIAPAASSKRYKENIEQIEIDSSKLNDLNPVVFNYKGKLTKDVGLIAEEVAEVIPEMVAYDIHGRPDAIFYGYLPLLLLKEVQRLNKKIEALEVK